MSRIDAPPAVEQPKVGPTSLSSSPRRCSSRDVVILIQGSIWGGAEAHAVVLAEALTSRGYSPTIFCLDRRTQELFLEKVQERVALDVARSVKSVQKRSLADWWSAFRPWSKASCIYGKGTLHSGNLALEVVARTVFSRFVTIEHLEPMALPPKSSARHFGGLIPGLGLWRHRMRLRGWVRSLMPHRVITVSDAVRERLRRDYRFASNKMVTIHNGADPSRFQPSLPLRKQTRDRWQTAEDTLVFGSLRRFVPEKGLDLAIEAFRRFVEVHPERHSILVLLGEGPEEVRLREQAETLGLRGRVLFPGFTREPWLVYPAIDVFVMPSRDESFGIALAEAMLCGCLPIATRVGGVPEILSSPELGWLVPPEDTEALAVAMAETANLAIEKAEAMRRRNSAHIKTFFDSSVQYSRIVDELES